MLLGSRDANISKTPFLLYLACRIITRDWHIAWEKTILHTCQIHIRKLKSLSTVQSHKNNIVTVFVKTVYIGYKRYLLQKATESRILLPLLVINSLVYKLINILNTLLCLIRALCLQLIDIAGLIDYCLYELRNRIHLSSRTKWLYKHHKRLYLACWPRHARHLIDISQCRIEIYPLLKSIVCHLIDACSSDAALWHIYYSLYRKVIMAIVNSL